jgi:hypothetical protein
MKKYLFLLLCILSMQNASAQFNLVPNPSFEDTVYCPTGKNQLNASEHWQNFGNSPDYFNACSNPAFAVPNSNPGFQYAHTGNAYAGAIFFARVNIPNGPNYREPLGVELSSTLVIGQKYYVSFFAVNAEVNFGSIACDKLGMNFYTVAFDSCCPPPLSNSSKLYTDSILIDTLNWIKITGSFIADSAYKFLSISNFFNDSNTDTLKTSQFPTYAYYYIDDVCVSTDSLYNDTWTGINQTENTQNSITIFPNPSTGFFSIESPIPIDGYSLYNMHGQLICERVTNNTYSTSIDLSSHSNGIYIIRLYSNTNTSTHKIILSY